MNKMNTRTLLILAILVSSFSVTFGQEKGWHLSFSGNYGANTLKYTLDNKTKSEYPLGWGAGLTVQYFPSTHWGISFGAEWFDYNGVATYKNDYKNDYVHYATENMHYNSKFEPDKKNYNLLLGLNNWKESQHAYVLNIPVMAHYQTKWGSEELVGMYLGLGVKFQIPIMKHSFTVNDGDLAVQALFKRLGQDDLLIPDDEDLAFSGSFGYTSIDEGANNKNSDATPFKGNMTLKKFSVAASGEIGFLFSFSRRVDFAVGAYIDYGLLNIKGRNVDGNSGKLIMPTNNDLNVLSQENIINKHLNTPGDGLQYNGLLNSHATNHTNLFAFGGKATLRIKIGKLEGTKQEAIEDAEKRIQDEHDFYERLFKEMQDSLMKAANSQPCCGGFKSAEESDKWNPEDMASPNNPKNENYDYPVWYVPDYVNDPNYRDKRGLEAGDEGPNNPEAVNRNKQKAAEVEAYMLAPIFFDLGKYDIRDSEIEVLDRKVALMKKYPNLNMSLIGHTCDLGSDKSNDVLSSNRTISARNYMIRKGIKASRLDLVPMGKHHPDYPNNAEANREKNRRVDFIIVN
jgi:outer membrane protein OmpA-like peptidoglycan-associated protein